MSSTLENKRKNIELSPIGNSSVTNRQKALKMDDSVTVVNLTVGALKVIISDTVKENNKDLHDEVKLMTEKMNKLIEENLLLKANIAKISEEAEKNKRNLLMLEDNVKRRNLIFKGIPSNDAPFEAVSKVIKDQLKVTTPIHVKATKKIFDRNGSMGVIAELDGEQEVRDILRNTRNLAGSRISIEKDLNHDRQECRKAMVQLRRNILEVDNTHRVQLRDDKLRIEGSTFHWNRDHQFMSGQENGQRTLNRIYGNNINNIEINFENLVVRNN